MRRRAILEGAIKAAEALLDRHRVEDRPDQRPSPSVSGMMVADAARGELEAVADEVVLVGLDRQRVLVARARRSPPCSIENGLWAKSSLFSSSLHFIEREVDDPGELEALGVDEAEIGADARPRLAGEAVEALRIAGDEEDGIAVLEAKLLAQRLGAFIADVLGHGAAPSSAVGIISDVVKRMRVVDPTRPVVFDSNYKRKTKRFGADFLKI